ncbi:MAG: tetratricopeptide repeat protein [Promethearchaeota archaeon]
MSLESEFNKGLERMDAGDYHRASEHFKRCTQIDPGDYNSWIYLGIVILELERPRDAIVFLKRCLEIDDTLPYAYSNMGLAYQKMRDVYEAARYFYKALKIDPTDVATHLNLGIAYMKIRNKELDAINQFRYVIEADDSIAEAWHYLGLVLFDTRRSEMALYCFEKARALGIRIEKNSKMIRELRFDDVKPKNPFDDDVRDSVFNPLKRKDESSEQS